jgi:hypothetical protein
MEASAIERRGDTTQDSDHLRKLLTLPQVYGIGRMANFGYSLAYVRDQSSAPLAILVSGDCIATVDTEGDVDSSPSIALR